MTTKFGKWQIDPNTGMIKFIDPDVPQLNYEIPLYERDKSSKFLDWIRRPSFDLAGLLAAMNVNLV